MDGRTGCNHGAHPRCGNDGPECIQHACAPHGQYRSEAQWFAAGSGRCRMGSCQDAGDGDERHAGKTTVPHWVRGKEYAVLTRWPGMPPGTTLKIVVTALGNSAPTSENGLTAMLRPDYITHIVH